MSLFLSTIPHVPVISKHRFIVTLLKEPERTSINCAYAVCSGATKKIEPFGHNLSATGFGNSLRGELLLRSERRGVRVGRVVCSAVAFSPHTLQWISAASSVILMFMKGTPIQKSFLVPFFALQAPAEVISWIKGEQGIWTAFLVLLVRLFYFIPGELELPFQALLLLIVAPYQSLHLRGTPAGAVISLVIAGYLAYHHFSRIRSLRGAFDQGTIVATLSLICAVSVPCFFLF